MTVTSPESVLPAGFVAYLGGAVRFGVPAGFTGPTTASTGSRGATTTLTGAGASRPGFDPKVGFGEQRGGLEHEAAANLKLKRFPKDGQVVVARRTVEVAGANGPVVMLEETYRPRREGWVATDALDRAVPEDARRGGRDGVRR